MARLRALEVAGGLAYWSGDIVDAHRRYQAAAEEARRLGDDRELANALYNLGFAPTASTGVEEWSRSIAESGTRLAREALEIFQRLGDDGGSARCQWAIGMGHLYGDDAVGAVPVLTEAIGAFERLEDSFDLAWALQFSAKHLDVYRREPELCAAKLDEFERLVHEQKIEFLAHIAGPICRAGW